MAKKKKQAFVITNASAGRLAPGQAKRFCCDRCFLEFEVCLEPKQRESVSDCIETEMVEYCPFCSCTNPPEQD